MKNRFIFGELNPNIVARNGPQIDPERFSIFHVNHKMVEQYLSPSGFDQSQGPLRGIVLRIETDNVDSGFGPFHGLQDVSKLDLVKIKVRIPELHPFPDPSVYGPSGEDGVISLYPTFIAINSDISAPAVGDIVYVDYGDRKNFEDPKYYGPVFKVPIFGGINVVETTVNIFDDLFNAANDLKDFINNDTGEPQILTPNPNIDITTNIIRSIRNFWQGDKPWGPVLLGNSNKTNISQAGCLLTSLTMATNFFNKTSYIPSRTNTICQNAQVFDGANLLTAQAATTLNMTTSTVIKNSISAMKDAVDLTLNNGGLAILHVEFNPQNGNTGDHFILIHSRKDGVYIASDPAYGTYVNLLANLSGDTTDSHSHVKLYKPISVTPIFGNKQ